MPVAENSLDATDDLTVPGLSVASGRPPEYEKRIDVQGAHPRAARKAHLEGPSR